MRIKKIDCGSYFIDINLSIIYQGLEPYDFCQYLQPQLIKRICRE